MKWKNKWALLLSFLFGVFGCYLTLQFQYFDLKMELDIPNLILSAITLVIGLYIADTLQNRINRNQNQHSYLINKLDSLWELFNKFSEIISYNNKVEASSIKDFNKEVIYPISFLKNVFISFDVDNKCVCDLEENLDKLDQLLTGIQADDNIVYFQTELPAIESRIIEINQCFSETMKQIQNF